MRRYDDTADGVVTNFIGTRKLDSDHLLKLHLMRRESIEVTRSLHIISDAALTAQIRPMKLDRTVVDVTASEELFYDTTLLKFCKQVVWDLACYGIAVYFINDANVPISVPMIETVIVVRVGPNPVVAATYRDLQWMHTIKLMVVVDEMPDAVTGKTNGALSKCQPCYMTSRILQSNELSISTSNAQRVFTLQQSHKNRPSDLLKAVNYDHENGFSGRNDRGEVMNPNGPSAEQLMEAGDEIYRYSLLGNKGLCDQINGINREFTTTNLHGAYPGIQTDIQDKIAYSSPAIMVPVPLGCIAEQYKFTPEMVTLNSQIESISRMIYESFGVASVRTDTTLQNGSLYHSGKEIAAQEARIQKLGEYYRHLLVSPLSVVYARRTDKGSIRRAAKRKLVQDIEVGADVDSAVEDAIKVATAHDGVTLHITPTPSVQYYSALFDAGIITWDAIQRFLTEHGNIAPADFAAADPRQFDAQLRATSASKPKPKPAAGTLDADSI